MSVSNFDQEDYDFPQESDDHIESDNAMDEPPSTDMLLAAEENTPGGHTLPKQLDRRARQAAAAKITKQANIFLRKTTKSSWKSSPT